MMRFIEEYWVFLIGIQLVFVGLLVLDLKLRKIKSKVVSISESLKVISEHLGVDKKRFTLVVFTGSPKLKPI